MKGINRRKFLNDSLSTTLGVFTIPSIVDTVLAGDDLKPIKLEANSVILFQGDSITDGGRDRTPPNYNTTNADRSSEYNDFNVLGCGYPLLAATNLLFHHPAKRFRIFNRGISGNKVFQLAERWEEDCIQIKPSVLSIMIGVNDYWHTLSHGYTGTSATYRNDYKALLEQTKEKLPDVQLIIGEPFAIKGVGAVT